VVTSGEYLVLAPTERRCLRRFMAYADNAAFIFLLDVDATRALYAAIFLAC